MYRRSILISATLLIAMTATLSAGSIKVGGLSWYDNLKEAKKAAASSGKNIYIYFTGGSGCGWCVKMKKNTFSNSSVHKKVLKKVERVMLNVWVNPDADALSRDKALFAKYGGRGVPFNTLLDSKGQTIATFGGYMPPDAFTKKMSGLDGLFKKYIAIKLATKGKTGYDALMKRFTAAKALDRTGEAGKLAKKLQKLDPDNKKGDGAELAYARALAFTKTNDGTKASGLYNEVIRLDANNAKKMAEQASAALMSIHFSNRDYKKAISVGKKAITYTNLEKRINAWFHLALGYAYKKDNNKARAKKHLNTCIKILPSGRMAYSAKRMLQRL